MQNLPLKMNVVYTLYYSFIFESHKACKLEGYEAKMFCYLHLLYFWCVLNAFLPTFTKFDQSEPSFIFSYQLLTSFYKLLPLSTIFHQLLLPSIKFYQLLYQFPSFFMLLMFFLILSWSVVTHVINMTIVFKVISSDNLLSVSFNILISSIFSMPIISLILSNTL